MAPTTKARGLLRSFNRHTTILVCVLWSWLCDLRILDFAPFRLALTAAPVHMPLSPSVEYFTLATISARNALYSVVKEQGYYTISGGQMICRFADNQYPDSVESAAIGLPLGQRLKSLAFRRKDRKL
jgi:hypothetical protein